MFFNLVLGNATVGIGAAWAGIAAWAGLEGWFAGAGCVVLSLGWRLLRHVPESALRDLLAGPH